MDVERIQTVLAERGVTRFGFVPVREMVFHTEFRAACEANQCGKYGTSWSCPPGVGAADNLIARARRFREGLVIQTVWPLEDAFDFDGMMEGGKKHTAYFRAASEQILPLLPPGEKLTLSAGVCSVCESCTYLSGDPCRAPERAIASLEAYCIDVARLIEHSGLAYTNGPNTVSYVGLILFGTAEDCGQEQKK